MKLEIEQSRERAKVVGADYDKSVLDESQKVETAYLGNYESAHEWQKDNHYILTGYRINYRTVQHALGSCCQVHNETGNIATHCLGFLMAVGFLLYICFEISNTRGIEQKIENDLEKLFSPVISDVRYRIQEQKIQLEDEFDGGMTYTNNSNKHGQPSTTRDPTDDDVFSVICNLPDLKLSASENYFFLIESIDSVNQALKGTEQPSQSYLLEVLKDLKSMQKKFYHELAETGNLDWVLFYQASNGQKSEAYQLNKEQRSNTHPDWIRKWPLIIMIIGSFACFGNSVLYHTFFCMSHECSKYLLRIDYASICIIIAGCATPIIYYSFYCEPLYYQFYLIFVYLSCLTTFILSIFDFIHQEKYRNHKGVLYGGLGLFAAIPMLHACIRAMQHNLMLNDYLSLSDSIYFYFLTGFFLWGGLLVYLSRCPESSHPGRFDIFLNSHQIWHMGVNLGVLSVFIGSIKVYYERKQTFCYV